MIEKIKAVNNPLTIIAIFAALAEIAGTTVLAVVDKEIQHIFVWFVMLFPSLLVGLFFFTLYSKARVLYAPSDFKDEKNFLIALAGTHNLFVTVDELRKQLEEVKSMVSSPALEQTNVTERLNSIEDGLASVRQTAETVASAVVSNSSIFVGQGFSTEAAASAASALTLALW
jgi:hypothetical protein